MVTALQGLFYIALTPIVIQCMGMERQQESRRKDASGICRKSSSTRGLTKHKQLH